LLPFNDLVAAVTVELERVKYTRQRISRYASIWDALGHYMRDRGLQDFDMTVGLAFLHDKFNITVFTMLPSHHRIRVRAVNMLGEYQLHGMLLSKRRTVGTGFAPMVHHAFTGFIDARRCLGISEKTLQANTLYLTRFSDYLVQQHLEEISHLTAGHVLGMANTLAGFSNATAHCTLGALRVFLRYLYDERLLDKDLSVIVPHVKLDKTSRIPSAYKHEEVQRLLNSIDRGNPKGKRDYAIVLLAARLGMRAGDICRLSFSNLKWSQNVIELCQGKTQEPLVLPLLPEVGSAIIAYLKYGRPSTESATIFVRHTCPITPLTPPTLHSIVWQYLQRAGIHVPDGKKHGPHALRHSLASTLLEHNVPLPIISEVLGHTSAESTKLYLKIDIPHLRQCALEVSTFAWNQAAGGDAHVL
jgi:site-specific recombinase XerD